MSVIGKLPFIEETVSRLSALQLADLKLTLDGTGQPIERSLVNEASAITEDDKGVSLCHLRLYERSNPLHGILIYNEYGEDGDEQCRFLGFSADQYISLYEIDLANRKHKLIAEYCDIEEVRRALSDYKGGDGDYVTEEAFEELVAVTPTAIGTDNGEIYLEHDGEKLSGQTSVKVAETIYLESLDYLSDFAFSSDGSNTTITTSVDTILTNRHTLLSFECETSGTHFGASGLIIPCDADVCFIGGRVLANGSFRDWSAAVDEDGSINIVIYGVSLNPATDEVKVKLLTLGN